MCGSGTLRKRRVCRGLLLQNASLRHLARIPLMLALIVPRLRAWPAAPGTAGELYRKCLWGLLQDWKEIPGGVPEPPVRDAEIDATLNLLAVAAFRLLLNKKEPFDAGELVADGFGSGRWLDRASSAARCAGLDVPTLCPAPRRCERTTARSLPFCLSRSLAPALPCPPTGCAERAPANPVPRTP